MPSAIGSSRSDPLATALIGAEAAAPAAERSPARPLPARSWSISRPSRVVFLVVAILVLSAADLAMTMTYALSTGLHEGNPIARTIMMTSSPWAVVGWKLGTVGLGCLIFVHARRHRVGEIGAWAACLVLVWLTLHWFEYNESAHTLTPYIHALGAAPDSEWIAMVPGE